MTNKTSDYYQADEQWWQKSYNEGKGRSFHSKVEYDKSAGFWGIALYVPIYDRQQEMIGIIKAFLEIRHQ